MSQTSANVLPMPAQGIAAYSEFRGQLAELKAVNAITVFDYESKEGNKAARSYIYKLRQTKAAVEKARQAEKAHVLELGRKIDSEAKEIIGEVESMIAVHQAPIDEIENREKQRIESIKSRIRVISLMRECTGHSSEETAACIATLRSIVIDESFGEFQLEAFSERDAALAAQEAEHASALVREAEKAELERLRKEAEERQRAEREEAIRAEATAKALAKAEADRIAAEAKAEADKRAAVEAERQRIQRETAAKEAAEAKRAKDEQNVKRVRMDIEGAIFKITGDVALSVAITEAIVSGDVPHIQVIF